MVGRGVAAETVGVTRQLVNAYCRDFPAFREEMDRAEMDANEPVEDALALTVPLVVDFRVAENWGAMY